MNMIYCRECGNKIHQSARSCPSCGAMQRPGAGKSKVAAGFLALFLGGLGIHRFYLGQWWGVFYLLFCWTLFPAMIAAIEAIVFFCSDEMVWERKYG